MKKLFSLFIAFVMIALTVASAIPVGAADEGKLAFSMTNAAGVQNEEITIDLNIDENDGFWTFWLLLYYDEDLILRDTAYNEELSSVGSFSDSNDNLTYDQLNDFITAEMDVMFHDFNVSKNDKNFKVIMFDSNDLNNDVKFTGKVATFTFQIMGIAEDGDYTVGVMPWYDNNFNCAGNNLSLTWKNATVHVGSDEVPADDQKTITPQDTASADAITEEPEGKTREDFETDEVTQTEPPETFIGEDGVAYVTNDEGETVPYEPETVPEAVESLTETDTETYQDVAGEDSELAEKTTDERKTVNLFGLELPLVYLIAGAVLILIIIAAVLLLVISKTKKTGKKAE